jgi:predicted nucleotidyltransferase
MIHPAVVVPKDAIVKLCRENAIREMAIFGSATRVNFEPSSSDIDIVVDFKPGTPIGYFELFEIQEALESVFNRKVGLVSRRGLNKHIRDEVLPSREIIYAQ